MNFTLRAVGTLMLGPALSLGQPGGGPPPALFVLDQARMEPVEQWREVTGELRALRRASVASRQAGQLTEVLIDDGVTVATGQVIAHPDSSLAKLELDRAIASERAKRESVAVRERELDRWKREWARYEKLEGNQSVSESEVDQVRSQVVVGEASLSLARADAASAQADDRAEPQDGRARRPRGASGAHRPRAAPDPARPVRRGRSRRGSGGTPAA